MIRSTTLWLRAVYCAAVLFAIIPFGLASSGWVQLSLGGGLLGMASGATPLVFLLLGLYRVFLVVRVPGTLNCPMPRGFARVLRVIGVCGLCLETLVGLLGWIGRPLVRMYFMHPSDNGIEFYIVGMFLSIAGSIGVLGIFLFEFSRILSFERCRA